MQDIVMTGGAYSPIDFGGGGFEALSNLDVFVAKLDGNGDHIWSKRATGINNSDAGTALAVDGAGDVVVTGWFASDSIDFGEVP